MTLKEEGAGGREFLEVDGADLGRISCLCKSCSSLRISCLSYVPISSPFLWVSIEFPTVIEV